MLISKGGHSADFWSSAPDYFLSAGGVAPAGDSGIGLLAAGGELAGGAA